MDLYIIIPAQIAVNVKESKDWPNMHMKSSIGAINKLISGARVAYGYGACSHAPGVYTMFE